MAPARGKTHGYFMERATREISASSKRSIEIHGRQTSMNIEEAFWTALQKIAADPQCAGVRPCRRDRQGAPQRQSFVGSTPIRARPLSLKGRRRTYVILHQRSTEISDSVSCADRGSPVPNRTRPKVGFLTTAPRPRTSLAERVGRGVEPVTRQTTRNTMPARSCKTADEARVSQLMVTKQCEFRVQRG